jgi:hypothetical protein
VDTFVVDTSRAAQLAVAGDAVSDLAEAAQLFDFDLDQVSGMVPFVVLDTMLGFQIPESPLAQTFQGQASEGNGAASIRAMCFRCNR